MQFTIFMVCSGNEPDVALTLHMINRLPFELNVLASP